MATGRTPQRPLQREPERHLEPPQEVAGLVPARSMPSTPTAPPPPSTPTTPRSSSMPSRTLRFDLPELRHGHQEKSQICARPQNSNKGSFSQKGPNL